MANLLTSKETLIQEYLRQGKRYSEIAKDLHVSPKTIAKVSREMREPSQSSIFQMFKYGKDPWDIVIETSMDSLKIQAYYDAWVKMLQNKVLECKAKEDLAENGVTIGLGTVEDVEERQLAKVEPKFKYVCSKCGELLGYSEEDAKRLGKCPKCEWNNWRKKPI